MPAKPTDARHKERLGHHPLWILEPALFESVLKLVSKYDPEGILLGGLNPRGWTEYSPEVEAMLPQLKRASGAADVERVIREVFRRFFGTTSRKPHTAIIYRKDRHGQWLKHRDEVCHDFASLAEEIWKCIRRPAPQQALARMVDVRTPIERAVKKLRKLRPKSDKKFRLALIAELQHQAREIQVTSIFGDYAVSRKAAAASSHDSTRSKTEWHKHRSDANEQDKAQ